MSLNNSDSTWPFSQARGQDDNDDARVQQSRRPPADLQTLWAPSNLNARQKAKGWKNRFCSREATDEFMMPLEDPPRIERWCDALESEALEPSPSSRLPPWRLKRREAQQEEPSPSSPRSSPSELPRECATKPALARSAALIDAWSDSEDEDEAATQRLFEPVALRGPDECRVVEAISRRLVDAFGVEAHATKGDDGQWSASVSQQEANSKLAMRALRDALAGCTRWGTQIMPVTRAWPEYEAQIFDLLFPDPDFHSEAERPLATVEKELDLLVHPVEGRGLRLCACLPSGLTSGQDKLKRILQSGEERIKKIIDLQVVSEHLVLSETAAVSSEALPRLTDFTHIKTVEERTGDKYKALEVLLSGHPLAAQQAAWMWQAVCSNQVVDCLPLRVSHAPKGQNYPALISRMQQVQERYPQVTVEIRPAAPSSNGIGPTHQLWFFSADDELLLACRSELVGVLDSLFPKEYMQLSLSDPDAWASHHAAEIQVKTGVAALLDRQRYALFVCGCIDDVARASDYVDEVERDLLASKLDVKGDEADDAAPVNGTTSVVETYQASGQIVCNTAEDTTPNPDCHPSGVNASSFGARCTVLGWDNGGPAEKVLCEFSKDNDFDVSVFNVFATEAAYSYPADCMDDSCFVWYYVDDDDVIQGPFDRDEMEEWWTLGFLPGDLAVCCQPACDMPPDERCVFCPIMEMDAVLAAGVQIEHQSIHPDKSLEVVGCLHSTLDGLGA